MIGSRLNVGPTQEGHREGQREQRVGPGQVLEVQKRSQPQVDRVLQSLIERDEDGHLDQQRQAARHRVDLVLAHQLQVGHREFFFVVRVLLLELRELGLHLLHALRLRRLPQRDGKHAGPHQHREADDGDAVRNAHAVEDVEQPEHHVADLGEPTEIEHGFRLQRSQQLSCVSDRRTTRSGA